MNHSKLGPRKTSLSHVFALPPRSLFSRADRRCSGTRLSRLGRMPRGIAPSVNTFGRLLVCFPTNAVSRTTDKAVPRVAESGRA